jgi:hypothetical protein
MLEMFSVDAFLSSVGFSCHGSFSSSDSLKNVATKLSVDLNNVTQTTPIVSLRV